MQSIKALLKQINTNQLPPLIRWANHRMMRLERVNTIKQILTVLVSHTDLGSGCAVRPLGQGHGDKFATLSVSYLSKSTGICERTVYYVLAFLKKHGWLKVSDQQKRRINGIRLCAGVRRVLTPSFWKLWGVDVVQLWLKDCKYAKKRPQIKIHAPVIKQVCGVPLPARASPAPKRRREDNDPPPIARWQSLVEEILARRQKQGD